MFRSKSPVSTFPCVTSRTYSSNWHFRARNANDFKRKVQKIEKKQTGVSYDRKLERVRPEFRNISRFPRKRSLLLSHLYLILVGVFKWRRKKMLFNPDSRSGSCVLQIRIQTVFAGASFLNCIKHYFHVLSIFCTWFSIVSNFCFHWKQ